MNIKEPSPEQCSKNALVYSDDVYVGYAIWYPQMGGYGGKSVALFNRRSAGECVDIYIWHNGEFPFDGEGEDGKQPVVLHLCSPSQFIRFGETMERLDGIGRGPA